MPLARRIWCSPRGSRSSTRRGRCSRGCCRAWGAQQRSRMLNEVTIGGRERLVQRFAEFTNEYPWDWRAEDVEGFTTTLRSGGVAHSTIRGYHNILGLFVEFVCDRR